MQLAIDSAKKRVAIDLSKETKYLKDELEIKEIGVPVFWRSIKGNVDYDDINFEIQCPMNMLYDIKPREIGNHDTLPISDFFIKHELNQDRRTSKKVERLIEDYAGRLFMKRTIDDEENDLLMMEDFDKLMERIKTTYISKGYVGIISWLLDRAFMVTHNMRSNRYTIRSQTDKNKAFLLKVLYNSSPNTFLMCFKAKEMLSNVQS